MSYVDWKLHGDDTVAAYLPEQAFRSVLEKRIAIAPDCAAILIRDGQIVGALHGAHLSVGGLWQKVKEFVGGRHSIRVLVADLKPFPVTVPLHGFTRDHVEIQAELALELALNPEKPADVMGLVHGLAIARQDVYNRLRPHLQERVVLHELVQHDAAHLRANRGLQDRIQAELMREVERIAGDLGVLVRAASLNWGLNADEAQAIAMRSLEREDRMREFEVERARRELAREAQSTILHLNTTLDVKRVEAANEAELSRLLLSHELELHDARTTGERLHERKALQHELELAQTRRLARFDEQIGEATHETDRRRIELERRRMELTFQAEARRQELEIQKLEQTQQLELRKAGQMQDLEVAGSGHDLHMRKLRDLQQLELDQERARHDLGKDDFLTRHGADMDKRLHEGQTELEKMRLQAGMSTDQILAIQAGLSPEVARVFAERAKADGPGREALLREMLEQSKQSQVHSSEQASAMFDRAVDALARVGSAAGRASAPAPDAAEPTGTSECPQCHFQVPVAHRFCKNCGHQMRT